jgi:hypothetical protein
MFLACTFGLFNTRSSASLRFVERGTPVFGKVFSVLVSMVVSLTAGFDACAQTIDDAQMRALRLTVAESVLATTSQLSEHAGPLVKDLSWYVDMSDRSWSLTMQGYVQKGPIEIGVSGFLWEDEAGTWIVTFSGKGKIANEPIQINGKVNWPLDKASSDRLKTNFRQVTKFGAHSTWAWIVGAEAIVGGRSQEVPRLL